MEVVEFRLKHQRWLREQRGVGAENLDNTGHRTLLLGWQSTIEAEFDIPDASAEALPA